MAVQEFNLDIADKEFIVLVGPSGCGKSTTLRMVAGLEEISGGELYIGDKLVNDVAPKDRDIAMVFQNYALYPHMGDKRITPIEIAQIGQWVENVYFGKPCGLMDQMASSVGGVVGIDFADPAQPAVAKIDFDLSEAGLALCILDSGADHADLTDEYAAVPAECKAVAKVCGGEVLREVPYETFLKKIPQCRKACSDRAVLRAFHFYADNDRVEKQVFALVNKAYDSFLQLVNESGHSSWEYLQNITPAGAIQQQAVGLTIAVAKDALEGKGAVRVHGGGFAGTVQAFVPLDMVAKFQKEVEMILGENTCHVMDIRPVGGIRLA